MTNAPRAVVVFVPYPAAGSPEPLRKARPIYPAKPRQPQWPLPKYTPPADQIAEIKRRGQELLAMVRSQRGG